MTIAPPSTTQKNKRETAPRKEHQPRPPKKITESYLYNAGLHYLERFPASSAHFRSVMMRKIQRSCRWHKEQSSEQCAQMLDQLISRFNDLGLLNDESYARGMVTSLRRSGCSTRLIHARLRQKGLTPEHIKEALAQLDEEENTSADQSELKAALRLARRKRIGPFHTGNTDEKTYEKSLAKLARAGFSYDIAKKVMDMEEIPEEAF